VNPSDVTITAADLRKRVDAATWVQLFDRDGDSVVNEVDGDDYAALSSAIEVAQSTVAAELVSAYPDGFTNNGGTLDAVVKSCAVAIALFEAVRYSPLDGPFRRGYDDALAQLKRYREGLQARLTQANGGTGPTFNDVRLGGVIDDNGDKVRKFGVTTDGSDGSDY